MDTENLRSQLLEERAKIDRILQALDGSTGRKYGKRTMSPEAREKIRQAQVARWKKQKAKNK